METTDSDQQREEGGRDDDGGEARKEVMEMEQEWQQK